MSLIQFMLLISVHFWAYPQPGVRGIHQCHVCTCRCMSQEAQPSVCLEQVSIIITGFTIMAMFTFVSIHCTCRRVPFDTHPATWT